MKVIPGDEATPSPAPREVIGIDSSGRLLVQHGEEVTRMKIVISDNGSMRAVPYSDKPAENDIDQLGTRKVVPVAARWAGVDQT